MVTTFVTKIKRQLLTNQNWPLSSVLNNFAVSLMHYFIQFKHSKVLMP